MNTMPFIHGHTVGRWRTKGSNDVLPASGMTLSYTGAPTAAGAVGGEQGLPAERPRRGRTGGEEDGDSEQAS
jgi:hypothetical protein